MLFKSVAPPKITELELNFMKEINSKIYSQGEISYGYSYIPISPEASNYQVGLCYDNVAQKIEKDGGYAIPGWCIWKSPVLLEAEHHYVWMSPEGNIFDITPKSDNGEYILFVMDPETEYKGYPIPSKRKILLNHPAVYDMVNIQNQIYDFQISHWVPYENRISASKSEMDRFIKLLEIRTKISFEIENLLRNS